MTANSVISLLEPARGFEPEEWERMCRLHALPEGWEHLPYEEFLNKRRVLMAEIIRKGFESLQ